LPKGIDILAKVWYINNREGNTAKEIKTMKMSIGIRRAIKRMMDNFLASTVSEKEGSELFIPHDIRIRIRTKSNDVVKVKDSDDLHWVFQMLHSLPYVLTNGFEGGQDEVNMAMEKLALDNYVPKDDRTIAQAVEMFKGD
jgi:hypothetical protein